MRELDAKNLLHKVRDSNDLLVNMVNKEYLALLKYNKTRVVDIDEDTDSGEEEVSDTDDEDIRNDLSINEQFRLSVIRGMRIDNGEKEKLKMMLKHKDKEQLWKNLNGL